MVKFFKSSLPLRARTFWSLAGLFCALANGCAATPQRLVENAVADYVVGDYPRAAELLRPVALKTNEDFVLNNCRLGSVELAAYNLTDAQNAFLRAYEVINSVGVNDGGRSLGAALVDEKVKVWKGEPFERAMANFYLGLIYYMQHDYSNARAAFENALFKLRDYGEEDQKDQYREVESNFVLGLVMLAKCYQRLDRPDEARKTFDRAIQLRPDLSAMANFETNQRSNMLLVVDFGYGPAKAKNFDGALVGFEPTPREAGPIPLPGVYVDGSPVPLQGVHRPPLDLLALGQDRRWESIDTIRTVKSVIGTGLIGAGAYEGLREHSDPGLALGLIAAGAVLKATSQADVRQWEMLPRTTFLLPLTLPPGAHDVVVDFPNVPGMRQEWKGLVAPPTGEATYYYRMQRYDGGPFTWPPGGANGSAVQ